TDEAAKIVLGHHGHLENLPNHEEINEEKNRRAHKPQFLSQNRKDEIGMLYREKIQLILGPLKQAAAPQLAGTDGDFGLNDLPALAGGILPWIPKNEQTALLVVLQQKKVGN